ncbi:MAG TPA: hypothetical protein PLX77_05975, partial [Candidatus Cloacimonadota bacterium]|nr:hypothetical protein [Candidatus Cloacimonadota bacterium]
LEAFCAANQSFQDALLNYVTAADSLKAKNAIALLAGQQDTRLVPYLEELLEQEKYLATCISSLGNLESEAGLQVLMRYKDLENERLRFLVARSIVAYESDAAKAALSSFEGDPSFLIQALIRKSREE